MPEKIKSQIRIALIGPESSGKSTLSELLGKEFNCTVIPEYGRTFLAEKNGRYSEEEALHCIRSQFEAEMQTEDSMIIIDTEAIMGKIWMEDKFGHSPDWITGIINDHPYDLYLLTYPDTEFIDDPVRENPGRREYFFNRYKNILEERKLPFVIIKGEWNQRLKFAKQAVSDLLERNQRNT
ncbi:MAG: ATPase [Bacteroidetes bacterium]|nr:MAG: ATPase [Bacteroidota bacterium]REK00365.1 MAG: ATPase [Bacteroidota bacterium]REK35484.1 MAG: ATPase [Bacteroidota bacterium]REK46832.1 MAG: ATPase [Bacteroidota bacterium]